MKTALFLLALTKIQPGDLPTGSADSNTISDILRVAFAVIGAFSLLMITVSGLRYIISGSDEQRVKKAKNGIIYSLVGLAVALFAQAIVYFVVRRI